jgi:hypothetical protein
LVFEHRGFFGGPPTVFARRRHDGPTRPPLTILASRSLFGSRMRHSFDEDGLRDGISFDLELKNNIFEDDRCI